MKENAKIVIHRIGSSFRECTRIEPAPLPAPGEGQVRVRNHFAGVNGVYDQMMCLDRVEHTQVLPPADTGVEAVGLVDAVGPGVTSVAPGDAVSTVSVGSAYRYWQLIDAAAVVPVPAATPEILSLIPSGVSALLALEQVGDMRRDETVCITAAAGGLGNIMTQLAVNAGNRVVAVCGGPAKVAAVGCFDVERVVDYRAESLERAILSDFRDRLDLVMESVGGEIFDLMVENLAPHGRLVICGYTSDRVPTETVSAERIYTKLYWKAASVRGFMNYRFAEHAPAARRRLLDMLDRGSIRPLVDPRAFRGLESVPDAVEHLLAGNNVGKVIVDLR